MFFAFDPGRKYMRRFLRFLLVAGILALCISGMLPSGSAMAKSKAKAKLDKTQVSVDTGEKFTLKYKTKQDIDDISYKVTVIDETNPDQTPGSEPDADYESFSVTSLKTGKYSFVFTKGGKYRITITGYKYSYSEDDWWYTITGSYSASCVVDVRTVGLVDTDIAVRKGKKKEIILENAELISAEPVEEDYWWYDEDELSKIKLDGNVIKGVKAGEYAAKIMVTYRTDKGAEESRELNVYVTDPQYEPIPEDDYLFVQNYTHTLNITGASRFSDVEYKSGDENVVRFVKGYWGNYYLELVGAGTAKITFKIDGKKFTDTVTVFDPTLSSEVVLLKKKKKQTLSVSGLPSGIETDFSSADKKIASVSKEGTIKAKKAGSTYISVNCGDQVYFTCSVTVCTNKKAIKVAKAAYSHIGAEYSQEKRMKDDYFDCSSLAWRSYTEGGIKNFAGATDYAPTAAGLAKELEEEGYKISDNALSPDELLPGDLLFYSSSTNDRYLDIDHVAMYYAADYSYGYNSGMIVHARSGGVQTGSYEGYIPGNIVMICRPLQ